MTKGYTFFVFAEAEKQIKELEAKPTVDLGLEEITKVIKLQDLAIRYSAMNLLYRIKNLTKKFSRKY